MISIFLSAHFIGRPAALASTKQDNRFLDAPNAALLSFLHERCGFFNGRLTERSFKCSRATAQLLGAIDGRLNRGEFKGPFGFGVAAFAGELEALLLDPRTHGYLEALFTGLRGGQVKDVFRFTMEWNGNDLLKTFRFFAVLFQDTSSATGHVVYLLNRFGPEKFARPIFLIREIAMIFRTRASLRLYPGDLHPVPAMSRAQYHFYVWGYGTLKKGDFSRSALGVPVMLEAIYGIFKEHCLKPLGIREHPGFFVELGEMFGRQSIPENILKGCLNRTAMPEESASMPALYLGYAGTLWAAGRNKDIVDYFLFRRAVSKNLKAFVRAWF